MTLAKWKEVVSMDQERLRIAGRVIPVTPEGWTEYRKAYLQFIASVDDATRVYEMENKTNERR